MQLCCFTDRSSTIIEKRKVGCLMKKVMSVVLVLLLAFSMALPASSLNESEDKILQNQAAANEQYQRLLDSLPEMDSSSNARSTAVDYYGGAYVNGNGDLVVCVTEDYDPDSEMVELYTGNDDIILETVAFTYNAISSEQDRIWSLQAELEKTVDTLDPNVAELVKSFAQSYIVQARNALVIAIKDISDEKIALFKEVYSNAAFLEFENGYEYKTTAAAWQPGSKLWHPTSSYGYYTTGFPVYFVNDDNEIERGFLTAGHAFSTNTLVFTNGNRNTVLGRCIRSQYSGSVDAALIQITNPNYYATEVTMGNVSLRTYSYCSLPAEGTQVTKKAAGPVDRVGSVVSVNGTVGVNLNHFVLTDLYNVEGDSGSVVYVSATAEIIGLSSATVYGTHNGENVTMCAVSKIESILSALDCQLWPCDGEDCELDDCICQNRFS